MDPAQADSDASLIAIDFLKDLPFGSMPEIPSLAPIHDNDTYVPGKEPTRVFFAPKGQTPKQFLKRRGYEIKEDGSGGWVTDLKGSQTKVSPDVARFRGKKDLPARPDRKKGGVQSKKAA